MRWCAWHKEMVPPGEALVVDVVYGDQVAAHVYACDRCVAEHGSRRASAPHGSRVACWVAEGAPASEEVVGMRSHSPEGSPRISRSAH